jgi:hypothetical protein
MYAYGVRRPRLLSLVLLRLGTAVAPVVLVGRVISVPVPFRKAGQPSHPGRTNPDS